MMKIASLCISLMVTFSASAASAQMAPSFGEPPRAPFTEPKMESHNLFTAPGRQVRPGITARRIPMATISVIRIDITEGNSTPDHNHPDEQIVILLEGSVKAYMGETEFLLDEPGDMITIPAYVPHTYTALEDSATIEVFGPGR